MREKVCVFWDNSNIFISAQNVAAQREGVLACKQLRIHFENLYDVAVGGRDVERAFCVGSVPPELEQVWDRLRATGVEVELYERGFDTGTEQGIDQCLQVHMLRAMADIHPPAIAVLITGDGSGYHERKGFYADLERMHKAGWGVEVISWDIACNKKLKAWAKEDGAYVPLEDFYEYVTFRERVRPPKIGRRKRRYAHAAATVN